MSDADQKIFLASQKGNLEELKGLTTSGAPFDINYARPNDFDNTPLIKAALQGHVEIVKYLLSLPKIDVNKPNRNGKTAIAAATEKKEEVLEVLLADGRVEINKCSPLVTAALTGKEAAIKILLAHPKIDVNAKGEKGLTPLEAALSKENEKIVKLLLDDQRTTVDNRHLEVSFKTLKFTPLILARPEVDASALSNPIYDAVATQAPDASKEAVLRILLKDPRVDPNRPAVHNETPLWRAAAFHSLLIVKLLLASGRVDATIAKNGSHPGNEMENGTTAVIIAEMSGDPKKKEIIEEYLKDPTGTTKKLQEELKW